MLIARGEKKRVKNVSLSTAPPLPLPPPPPRYRRRSCCRALLRSAFPPQPGTDVFSRRISHRRVTVPAGRLCPASSSGPWLCYRPLSPDAADAADAGRGAGGRSQARRRVTLCSAGAAFRAVAGAQGGVTAGDRRNSCGQTEKRVRKMLLHKQGAIFTSMSIRIYV